MNPFKDVAAELVKLKTDTTTLRKFSYSLSGALLMIGVALYFFSNGEKAIGVAGPGIIVAIIGFIAPRALRYLYIPWMGLAFTLGWFVSRIILCLLFYLVITPIGLIIRVSGKDLLNQQIDRDASTYWVERTGKEPSPKNYEKPF